jgi:hypothetical protein
VKGNKIKERQNERIERKQDKKKEGIKVQNVRLRRNRRRRVLREGTRRRTNFWKELIC